jgi:alpha-ketoglutarate-dependent taurine dioxygenase
MQASTHTEIAVRRLSPGERPPEAMNEAADDARPIVVEPTTAAYRRALPRILSTHWTQLAELLYRHGAILLRGFAVECERELENAILSVPGVRPMAGYFMAEPGRDRVAGTTHTFHTNTLAKTGGALRIGAIHSENYYSPDVPALQCFWCKQAPPLGGETAVFSMADVYDRLSSASRSKLEHKRSFVRSWPLSAVAARYRVPEPALESFLAGDGWPVVTSGGERRVALYKPSVWCHPRTGRRALQINLSAELATFDDQIRRRAGQQYAGWRWAFHRLSWRFPPRRRPPTKTGPPGVGALLDAQEIESLADSVWRSRSVFTWRRGDVLLLDNLQVAHAGMPGVGRRELRVMLCNPVALQPQSDSGILEASLDEPRESLHAQLVALGDSLVGGRGDTGA